VYVRNNVMYAMYMCGIMSCINLFVVRANQHNQEHIEIFFIIWTNNSIKGPSLSRGRKIECLFKTDL